MTRHLSFVAALGVCLCALHVTCHGQEVKTAREAAVARGGDSSPIMSVPHEKVEELVRGAKLLRERLTTQHQENIALLREQLDLNEGQVLAALNIVAENDVPLDLLVLKLVEIAERFKALQKAQTTLSSDDPKAASLEAKARKAIDAGELAQADALFAEVETGQTEVRNRAGTLVKRGEIALARLRYVEAATHFAKAASVFPPGSAYEDKRTGYITRQASALYQQGEDFDDNGALRLAIELYKQIIDLSPRERVPLQWAAIQNNLGNALRVLGGRENGTTNLEARISRMTR
jgi:tetratricopeptide (TPR) repeat protein